MQSYAKKGDVTVTLKVDIDRLIEALKSTSTLDPNLYCSFVGQLTDQKNKDYFFRVDKGKTVLWQGLPVNTSSNPNTVVNILAVIPENTREVFSDLLCSDYPKTLLATTETQTPEYNNDTEGDMELYSLYFNISWMNNGLPEYSITLKIDPKVIVNP